MRKKHIVLKLKAYLSLSKAAKRAKKARTSRKKGKKRSLAVQPKRVTAKKRKNRPVKSPLNLKNLWH